MRLTEIMDLYQLHSNPDSLDKHQEMQQPAVYRVVNINPDNSTVRLFVTSTRDYYGGECSIEFPYGRINATVEIEREEQEEDGPWRRAPPHKFIHLTISGTELACQGIIHELKDDDKGENIYANPRQSYKSELRVEKVK